MPQDGLQNRAGPSECCCAHPQSMSNRETQGHVGSLGLTQKTGISDTAEAVWLAPLAVSPPKATAPKYYSGELFGSASTFVGNGTGCSYLHWFQCKRLGYTCAYDKPQTERGGSGLQGHILNIAIQEEPV